MDLRALFSFDTHRAWLPPPRQLQATASSSCEDRQVLCLLPLCRSKPLGDSSFLLKSWRGLCAMAEWLTVMYSNVISWLCCWVLGCNRWGFLEKMLDEWWLFFSVSHSMVVDSTGSTIINNKSLLSAVFAVLIVAVGRVIPCFLALRKSVNPS